MASNNVVKGPAEKAVLFCSVSKYALNRLCNITDRYIIDEGEYFLKKHYRLYQYNQYMRQHIRALYEHVFSLTLFSTVMCLFSILSYPFFSVLSLEEICLSKSKVI